MQEFYNYVYRIEITFGLDDTIKLDLRKVLKLFETRKNGYSWPNDNDTLKVVTIEPEKWGKICLEKHSTEEHLHTVMQAGAHLSAKSEVYEDDIDAKIQMAFIANKRGVKLSEIEEVTNHHISKKAYKLLAEEFLKEFPEKLI
jgi:hypothetical protein